MINLKKTLIDNRLVGGLGQAVGEMVARRSGAEGEAREALELLAAAVVTAVQHGHSCLQLDAWVAEVEKKLKNLSDSDSLVVSEDTSYEDIVEAFRAWAETCRKMENAAVSMEDKANMQTVPLLKVPVGEDLKVYLNRYRAYEINIAKKLKGMLNRLESSVTAERIRQSCTYFEKVDSQQEDLQQRAVFNALKSQVSVVTGGPGTGKTTVLAIILAWKLHQDRDLKIVLCAPTGKASVRMKESIQEAVECALTGDDITLDIKEKLKELRHTTIHKLLSLTPNSDYSKLNESSPLSADLIVVDECSMMSLQLFSQLLSAVKPGAQLLLLGDKDQLTSVDAGNVMAELCLSLGRMAGEVPLVTRLEKNIRSKANPALCEFATKIAKLGDSAGRQMSKDDIKAALYEQKAVQARFQGIDLTGTKDNLENELKTALSFVMEGYADKIAKAGSYEEAFELSEKFKVLCAVREGRWGVIKLNEIMKRLLGIKGAYDNGMPIIITKNDPVTGLNNGDVGVCYGKRVYFPVLIEKDGEIRRSFEDYAPAQLPPHEYAFAMTIHKSQGSGYDNVFMVMPDKYNPVMTRELVYTGITRTKQNFTLIAGEDILLQAINNPTVRWSGLKELLEMY